jgi:hypothetical protein
MKLELGQAAVALLCVDDADVTNPASVARHNVMLGYLGGATVTLETADFETAAVLTRLFNSGRIKAITVEGEV